MARDASAALREKAGTTVEFVTVGVLSDTHGHLYQKVKEALQGADHIIHAGDIGSPEILTELRAIAPVTAVRGNCDYEVWAQTLPSRAELELGGVRILIGHVGAQLRGQVEAAEWDKPGRGFAVVITGHSHLALVERRGQTLHVNPGSAGPRRFDRPRTVARLEIRSARPAGSGARAHVEAAIVTVEGG